MSDPVTTTTITLKAEGVGQALELRPGVSSFGLTNVTASAGDVTWVPDPDNPDENTIFWVRNSGGATLITLTLTYPAE